MLLWSSYFCFLPHFDLFQACLTKNKTRKTFSQTPVYSVSNTRFVSCLVSAWLCFNSLVFLYPPTRLRQLTINSLLVKESHPSFRIFTNLLVFRELPKVRCTTLLSCRTTRLQQEFNVSPLHTILSFEWKNQYVRFRFRYWEIPLQNAGSFGSY